MSLGRKVSERVKAVVCPTCVPDKDTSTHPVVVAHRLIQAAKELTDWLAMSPA